MFVNVRLQLDYFVIKVKQSFPFAQFHKVDYELRNGRNRDKSGGGLIKFFKKGTINKKT